MRNLGCLVLAVLFLPIFLIIIGPLLVLTAVRGRQSVGPLMLNSSQYGPAGRIGALMLGLGLWLLIWGGMVWVLVNGLGPDSATTVTVATPTLASPLLVVPSTPGSTDNPANQPIIISAPTATGTLLPTNTPTVLVIIDPTATPNFEASLPITTAVPLETPLPADTVSTNTSFLTDTIILTGTAVFTGAGETAETLKPTVIFIPTPAANESQPNVDATAVPSVTVAPADTQAVIQAVEDGNSLLREAIALANEENLANMAEVWQGRALEKAGAFATDLFERYAHPLNVEFKYLRVPTIQRATPDEVTVVSQELWSYGGRTDVNQESFEFTYVLRQDNGTWVITYYSYLNLPTFTATVVPIVTPAP